MKKSWLETLLLNQIRERGLPEPDREVMLCAPDRRWRFDFVWRPERLTVEVQGGIWLQTWSGRSKGHAHPQRVEEDCEKSNEVQLRGWRILKVCRVHIEDGRALAWIEQALTEKGGV
jgi:very-short-patch-repair endonuclease